MKPVFYVSPAGNDRGAGTKKDPFLTIGRAQKAARAAAGAVVVAEKGIYRENLRFDSRDNGCTYLGDAAEITAGAVVPQAVMKRVPPHIACRLFPEAAENVRVVDLTALGYTAEDWGEVYPFGEFDTSVKYDEAAQGVNFEVFSGNRRMTLARYPNEGYLQIASVLQQGEPYEYPPQNKHEKWDEKRNHRGGMFLVDEMTRKRLRSWRAPQTAWIGGYPYHDWAEHHSPAEDIDPENGAVSLRYVSRFGYREHAEYYFYNVLEELDAPGEYWLDRKNGMLYVYPYSSGDVITLSMCGTPLVQAQGVNGLTLDGFRLTNVKSTAVVLCGDDCKLINLFIENAAEYAISVKGTGNTVAHCEITATGRGGIILDGGDRISLTPGNNTVVNNYIHDFSALYRAYQPGVWLQGVGNICAHNEIAFSPHMAVYYAGNDHVIEYNHIHDVVLYSEDAGAIYSGMDWTSYGTVIRHNLLREIGTDHLKPTAIYWDDALSGQTACGNVIINAKRIGIQAGGGRDNVIRDNIIIGDSKRPILYDSRAYDAYFSGGWFQNHVCPGGTLWQSLRAVPYKDGIWAEKYPALAKVTTDPALADTAEFPVNPAGAVVENNIIIHPEKTIGRIDDAVYTYGKVENNRIYASCEEIGFDPQTLRFAESAAEFSEIPVEQIGRNRN